MENGRVMPDIHMCRWISMMADWASGYRADDDKTGGQSAKKGTRCPAAELLQYAGPECHADGSGAGAATAGGGENVPERLRPIHSHLVGALVVVLID